MEFEDQLATAMRASVETLTPPVADLVAVGLVRGRRRRRRTQIATALAAAVALTLAGAGTVLVNHRSSDTTSTVAAGSTCTSVVRTGVLPTWARAGFSEPAPAAPHVLSAHGDFAAILFGATLSSPPAPDRNNKILWVSRVTDGAAGSLLIDAVRAGTTTHVRREVAGGPGPSIINLPQPGCWHLTLRWGANHDAIDLDYERP
jgi:hypothetical protein